VLRSFNSLALRQLRTRPLRSVLTAFGVVLGVGMVFGVLLLVGTIRATFDEVIDSAWGETDLIVMGEGNGTMAEETLDRIKNVEGVRQAAGMVGGMFTRLEADGSPVRGPRGQMLIAGYETKGYQPYDFRLVEGRKIAIGREIMVEQNWARDRGYDVGDRVRVAGPTGQTEPPIIGIFKLTSGLNVGGLGYAAMPLGAARREFDQPEGWLQISIAALDRGEVEPLRRRVEQVVGSGANVQTPGEVSDQVSEQLAGLNTVLYFFSGVALFVGGFLILNSFNITVLQRMRELGKLRTLGASRRMATASVLTEALIVGAVGTLLGLALGLGLASGLISLMRGMGVPVGALDVTPSAAITAAVIGIAVTLLAAFWPAHAPAGSRRSARWWATRRREAASPSGGWPSPSSCSFRASGSAARSGSGARARPAASRLRRDRDDDGDVRRDGDSRAFPHPPRRPLAGRADQARAADRWSACS
jgi:putative ABC transport system permease protein